MHQIGKTGITVTVYTFILEIPSSKSAETPATVNDVLRDFP